MDGLVELKLKKAFALLGLSVGGGALCGGAAGISIMPHGTIFLFGGGIGAAVGLFISPIVIALLLRKRVLPAALLIIPVSMVVAGFSFVAGPCAMIASVGVFCIMAAMVSAGTLSRT